MSARASEHAISNCCFCDALGGAALSKLRLPVAAAAAAAADAAVATSATPCCGSVVATSALLAGGRCRRRSAQLFTKRM